LGFFPVSSSSSLIAQSNGFSPFSNFPAGISIKISSAGFLNCLTSITCLSLVIATIPTPPLCSTISLFAIFSSGSKTLSLLKFQQFSQTIP